MGLIGTRPAVEKVPPSNLEAERATLGAMLLGTDASRDAIGKAATIVRPPDFYRIGHQRIAHAIFMLFEQGEKVDLLTTAEYLKKSGELESAGGPAYIGGLVDELPIVANIEEYARIIREKATMRRLMEIGSALFGTASEDAVPVAELLNDASQSLFNLTSEMLRGGMQQAKDLLLPEIERIEMLAARGSTDAVTGLPTGFRLLDEMTAGLQKEEFIVVAARPGQGKSSFILNVVENVCLTRHIPVLIFSLEMSASSLVRRLICSHARVDSQRVRRGHLFPEDKGNLMQALHVLDTMNIWIDDSPHLSPIEIRAKARRLLAESGQSDGLILVDYLQMMDTGHERGMIRMENRQQEIAYISRSLKAVAKDLKVPVVVASQLSRAPERREGRHSRPRLSDLRESGAIEQDADVVLFLYREEQRREEQPQADVRQGWVTQLAVAKQRNGPTGRFPLFFNRAYTRFDSFESSEITPEEE